MMTTFGDGRAPRPAAVAAALQGARLWLQTAIRDARTLRRRQRQVYRAAKDSLKADRPQKPALQSEWSNEILYRAGAGYDQLAYDPKCGFRTEDLRQLFPEAMNAYERWNQMHAETAESDNKGDDDNDNDDNNNKEEDDEEESKTPATTPIKGISSEEGGHLQERAAQFDLRTDKMQSAWYLKYATLRQGSFLPRSSRASNPSDADWDRARQEHQQQGSGGGGGFGTGRPKNNSSATNNSGSWAHMPAPTVRFLHWVGFEPQSVLPPPTDETTHALAFLGYDFFGRIVEKAILLRKNAQRGTTRTTMGQANNDDDDDDDEAAVLLLELEEGEQLEEDDIARAMEDPEIKPVPLYSADSSKNKKAGTTTQLYFGPGFENRLEMELEEMLASSCSSSNAAAGVSEEEMKIRQQEDAVFARLAAPPTQDAIAVALSPAKQQHPDKRNTPNKNNQETSARTTKRGRPKKRQKS